MDRETFIKYLKMENILIIENRDLDDYNVCNNWDRIKYLKSLTRHIDYKCKFKNNKCQGYKKWNENLACCCKDCFNKIGYFKIISEEEIDYYAERFKKYIGFWEKNKGCLLDRDKRSGVCLGYTCHDDKLLFEELHYLSSTIKIFERKVIDLLKG